MIILQPSDAPGKWTKGIEDNAADLGLAADGPLCCEISDEALEAAAGITNGVAMTLGTPTVSILVACC